MVRAVSRIGGDHALTAHPKRIPGLGRLRLRGHTAQTTFAASAKSLLAQTDGLRNRPAVAVRWIDDRYCCMLIFMNYLRNENTPRFRRWTYTAKSDEVSIVLPDGCIDILILSSGRTGSKVVRVTNWDFSPRLVTLRAGTYLTGYRLRPGTIVGLPELEIENRDLSNLEVEIKNKTRHDQEVTEIIDALAQPGSSVEGLARQQGVSERTLQRHFKSLSLPNPGFWRQLGRARRAVQVLPCHIPLSEIALEYGYCDQAHMTREFVRWFGRTPVRLRQNPGVMNDLTQPGLGNWSDEIGLEHAGLT